MSAPSTPPEAGRPTPRVHRAIAALAVAMLGAAITTINYRLHPALHSDFDPLWVATRALLAGRDPYATVAGLGWEWPLYYPLHALLVLVPFVAFPLEVARALFVAASGGLLAFFATRYRWWPVLFAASAPFFHAVVFAQWSPLLTLAVLLPVAGALLAVKPSSGLVLFLARPTWQAVAGGVALTILSLLVRPSWPGEWLHAVGQVTHLPAIRRPGGFLLLLALLRWKRPEARLLAALALIPVRPGHYGMLPLLLLVPNSLREALILVVGADIAFLFTQRIPPAPDIDVMDAAWWPWLLVFVLIPALVLVLRRPNRFARFGLLDPADFHTAEAAVPECGNRT